MKVYFKLSEEFEKCMGECQKKVNMDEDEKRNCDKECDKVNKGRGERVFFIF
jgi:hypothetical protein